ncbi:MAG: adenylate/guanylate cyclase domain-containing protein [Chloroflexota bacterium]|nr:MAG: adenylate/guanylate cyclase domain-containing protein [Chloroflexota bacterium]
MRYIVAIGLLAPVAFYVWLVVDPGLNGLFVLPVEHFTIVTLVSIVALTVALLVSRAATALEQRGPMVIALGFFVMAAFFSVHALTTPGLPSSQSSSQYATGDASGGYSGAAAGADPRSHSQSGTTSAPPVFDYAGTVTGASAYISIGSASILFALAYTPLLSRRRVRDRTLFLIAGAAAGLFGVAAFTVPDLVAKPMFTVAPLSYLVTGGTIALLLFAAWRQFRVFLRNRSPMQGAIVAAFILLAEAQAYMELSRFWSVLWWGYHILMLAAVVTAVAALVLELDRRRGLERFLPTEVVERVVTGDALRLGGERRAVTVMFADLRNSTAIGERLSAEDVVQLLNAYVGAMANCVFAEGGMLDKFLGDGVMAVFGIADRDGDTGAAAAIRAALRMREAIADVNRDWSRRLGAPIGFGVGIHTGDAVLGAVGIPRRSDFTVIGDTVNTAARVQELSKTFATDIVVTGDTVDRVGRDACAALELGSTPVRGRQEPVRVYGIA